MHSTLPSSLLHHPLLIVDAATSMRTTRAQSSKPNRPPGRTTLMAQVGPQVANRGIDHPNMRCQGIRTGEPTGKALTTLVKSTIGGSGESEPLGAPLNETEANPALVTPRIEAVAKTRATPWNHCVGSHDT